MNKWLIFLVICFCPVSVLAATSADYYKAGCQLYSQTQYDKATLYLKAAVKLDPQSWQAYQVLGQAYYQLGDQIDALQAFNQSLFLNPNNRSLKQFVDRLSGTSDAVSNKSATSETPKFQRSGHIYFELFGEYDISSIGALSTASNNFSSLQDSAGGPYATDNDLSQIGIGMELGLSLDKNDAISLVFNYGHNGSIGFNNADASDEYSLYAFTGDVGVRYYYYLPDRNGRWFGMVGPDLCIINVQYDASGGGYDTSATTMSSTAVGATLGVGRQIDFFNFLGFEIAVGYKFLPSGPITGPYSTGNDTTFTTVGQGQGELVTLSNGSIVLVDKSNVGSNKVTTFDFSSPFVRVALTGWF